MPRVLGRTGREVASRLLARGGKQCMAQSLVDTDDAVAFFWFLGLETWTSKPRVLPSATPDAGAPARTSAGGGLLACIGGAMLKRRSCRSFKISFLAFAGCVLKSLFLRSSDLAVLWKRKSCFK